MAAGTDTGRDRTIKLTIETSKAVMADPCDNPMTPSYWFLDNSSDHHFTCVCEYPSVSAEGGVDKETGHVQFLPTCRWRRRARVGCLESTTGGTPHRGRSALEAHRHSEGSRYPRAPREEERCSLPPWRQIGHTHG